MSDPQVENGYTRTANELFDAIIRGPFSKREYKIILAVIRKTYGYNKKVDDMSLSQLADLTNLARTHVCKTINELTEKKVLLKRSGKYGQVIGLNKKYSEWKCYQNSHMLPKQSRTVTKTVTKVLPKQSPQKTTPKDNTKRQLPKNFAISDRVRKWAKEKGHTNLEQHLENFIGQCEAKGYKYSNWDSAFMNAIRNNWAKIQSGGPDGYGKA